MTIRTQQEILACIEAYKDSIDHPALADALVVFLTYENAFSWAPDTIAFSSKAEWDAMRASGCTPLETIKNYLPLAWYESNSRYDFGVQRSIDRLIAGLWMAGYNDDVLYMFEDYQYYGKPQLVFCSTLVGFDWRAHDNAHWTNGENHKGLNNLHRGKLEEEWITKADFALLTRNSP